MVDYKMQSPDSVLPLHWNDSLYRLHLSRLTILLHLSVPTVRYVPVLLQTLRQSVIQAGEVK
jgi:hypothetical protein